MFVGDVTIVVAVVTTSDSSVSGASLYKHTLVYIPMHVFLVSWSHFIAYFPLLLYSYAHLRILSANLIAIIVCIQRCGVMMDFPLL
jgi:hypothetical protein